MDEKGTYTYIIYIKINIYTINQHNSIMPDMFQ